MSKCYVVSDLHGDGIMYNQIINFLENINDSTHEDISLYINGDIIDRGNDSISMLYDAMKREKKEMGNISLKLLAGNHEYMMNRAINEKLKYGRWSFKNVWFFGCNGGRNTALAFDRLSCNEKEEIIDYLKNLSIYHKFSSKINDDNILLVHAMAPNTVMDECHLKLGDKYNTKVYRSLWFRKEDSPVPVKIGLRNYLTIIGHTPMNTRWGYRYYGNQGVLNIDGGCAGYVSGMLEYDHTPLVELDFDNKKISLLIFNHNNEIFSGQHFTYDRRIEFNNEELEYYNSFLKKNKVKKRIR